MNDEIRYKAASAVVSLANRTESAGRKDAETAKGKSWQAMPFNPHSLMNPAKLREAVAYYEIAESIDRDAAGWGYPRALLLETMGAWDEAIAAFQALAGTIYAEPGEWGAKRCASKRVGRYDEFAEVGLPTDVMNALGYGTTEAQHGQLADDNTSLARQAANEANPAKSNEEFGDADEDLSQELAASTAMAFANRLLDRDYKAAQQMLHSWDAGMTAEDLRESFEPLFDGEAFPESASVFDVQTDLPQLELNDLAWVYVTINSENAEAVSLLVAHEKKRLVVRNVEFGRP
ncbi:MAG: hypothetical protein KDI56_15180 [Xanthomonadales bacterium]|nr:hypothetical protein [Xanthomonadales bacterium]MCB1635799.1 hypothetical protein [Xanthomonadales bacterium]